MGQGGRGVAGGWERQTRTHTHSQVTGPTADAVSRAVRAVNAIANPPPQPRADLTCDAAVAGRLIGPQGSTIKRLQQETSTHINVDSKRNPCEISIVGASHAAVAAARRAVLEILDPPKVVVLCDGAAVGDVIGPRGATIRRLQDLTGARISVDSERIPCEITISGATDATVAEGKRAVEAILHPPTVEMECQQRRVPRLLGPRGATVQTIQRRTGARINVENVVKYIGPSAGDEGGCVTVTIAGAVLPQP